tara:strand:+ start:998 stop:1414 length:417 start_codon:yes stop_codon:yes gene_type:complete
VRRTQLTLLEGKDNSWYLGDKPFRGVVYRGTESGRGPNRAEPAFFTNEINYANKYGSVWEYTLNLKKSLVIDAQEHEMGGDVEELSYDKNWLRRIKREGYDGMTIIDGKVTNYVAFNHTSFRLKKKDAHPSYYADEDD